jgi:hypothetical protein
LQPSSSIRTALRAARNLQRRWARVCRTRNPSGSRENQMNKIIYIVGVVVIVIALLSWFGLR